MSRSTKVTVTGTDISGRVIETATLGAYAWTWGRPGNQTQICWPGAGSHSLLFAFQPSTGPNAGHWTSTLVMARERWDHDGTRDGAAARVQEFIDEHTRAMQEHAAE